MPAVPKNPFLGDINHAKSQLRGPDAANVVKLCEVIAKLSEKVIEQDARIQHLETQIKNISP